PRTDGGLTFRVIVLFIGVGRGYLPVHEVRIALRLIIVWVVDSLSRHEPPEHVARRGRGPRRKLFSGPSAGPRRLRSRRPCSSALTWYEVTSGAVTTVSPVCSAGGFPPAAGPATRTAPPC